MRSKRFGTPAMVGLAAIFAMATPACAPAAAQATAAKRSGANATQVYVAHLQPLNESVTARHTAGTARFVIQGDKLTISIKVRDAAPDIVHWQHLHGFKDSRDAACPTQAADINHDGVIDLIESEPTSGTTMVPLDENPVAMQVAQGTYPKALADGTYRYRKVVSLKALEATFSRAFPGQQLDLSRRVVMIHGVPGAHKLPSSVASLGPIPAHVTLPIACGKIERASH